MTNLINNLREKALPYSDYMAGFALGLLLGILIGAGIASSGCIPKDDFLRRMEYNRQQKGQIPSLVLGKTIKDWYKCEPLIN